MTTKHITEVNSNTIAVGDLVEQSGATYKVTEVRRSQYFNGIEALYYTWTGSQESDTFRSIVYSKGVVGQIRWQMPYYKETE